MLDIVRIVLLPFLIGVVAGMIASKSAKLFGLFVALCFLLVCFGTLSLSPSEWLSRVENIVPLLYRTANSALNLMPFSSVVFVLGFLAGLVLGK